MKKAIDDETVDYKANKDGEEGTNVDKNWIASRIPYTERSGSSRVRGFSNGTQWGNRVNKVPKKQNGVSRFVRV